MSADWSRLEVEAVVADYFAMLAHEMRDEPYSKTAHRRALSALLHGRSDGSIERKHQNISAILLDLRHPWILGYKPLSNYQRLLGDVVVERLLGDRELGTAIEAAIEKSVDAPAVDDFLSRLEDRPVPASMGYGVIRETPGVIAPPVGMVDRLEQEARNSQLGRAGEQFVIDFERARLRSLGKEKLAESIEHISVTEGDGAGFDVLSFEPDGSERFIEVKTTAFAKQTPFFLSVNELRVSRKHEERYQLYRVFRFRRDPRLFMMGGALDQTCRLDPIQFRARVA